MKRLSLLSILCMSLLFSCKKDDAGSPAPANPGNPTTNTDLPSELRNILSDSLLTDLQNKGLVVNKGNTPPNIEGIFLGNPMIVVANFGPSDTYKVGKDVGAYMFRFYNQVGTKANMDYKNRSGSDTTTGTGTLISGSGNKFTLYAQSSGIGGTTPYKVVSIVSGEISSTALKNVQFSFTLTEKEGDEFNFDLVPVGKSRLYKDGDASSPRQNSYSF